MNIEFQTIGELFAVQEVAERQGFEPWKDLHPCRFSRPVHSTTLPSLRQCEYEFQRIVFLMLSTIEL